MGGLGLWIRSEYRNGWRALVGLTVLVAIGGGVTIAAYAGARRADTAFDRFLDVTSNSMAVSVTGTNNLEESIQLNVASYPRLWGLADDMAAIPGVDGVTPVSWMAVALEVDGEPQQFYSIATGAGSGTDPPTGVRAIHGRLANATADDEVVINEEAAHLLGVDVGDTIPLRSYATDQGEAWFGSVTEPDRGPRIEVEVVGIVRRPEDVSDNPEAFAILPEGFRTTYGPQIANCDCSFWIRTAPENIAGITAALATVIGEYPLAVQPVDGVLQARVERAVGLEVGALRIAAIVAGIAALLVVSQAVARHVGSGRRSWSALTAIGVTRAEMVRGWAVILAPLALLGAVGAVAVATTVSPIFPRGLARRAEPDPGVRIDPAAFLVGALMIVAVVVAVSVIGALLVTGRARSSSSAQAATRFTSWGSKLHPPIALGFSMAADPGRDRARLAAASAVLGLTLAVGGCLAVILIDRSVTEVFETPSAFGVDWDLQLADQPDDPEAVIAAISAEPIEAFALQKIIGNAFVVTSRDGNGLVSPQTFDNLIGSMGPIIDRGRPAMTADDVVLGDRIASKLGVDVDDTVTVDSGMLGDQTFRVSGIGRLSDGDETDQVFFVSSDGLARLQVAEDLSVNAAYVRLGEVDDATRQRLLDLGLTPAQPPSRVANLDEIGSVPRLLAAALVVLGLAGMVNALVLSVNRRRGDIAIVRALGFTPGQVRAAITWQGVVTACAAIVIGVPVGLFVGRVVWKQVADGVGAVDLVSIPWLAVVVIPIAALVIVTAMASIVGCRAAALDPATVLRSE